MLPFLLLGFSCPILIGFSGFPWLFCFSSIAPCLMAFFGLVSDQRLILCASRYKSALVTTLSALLTAFSLMCVATSFGHANRNCWTTMNSRSASYEFSTSANLTHLSKESANLLMNWDAVSPLVILDEWNFFLKPSSVISNLLNKAFLSLS